MNLASPLHSGAVSRLHSSMTPGRLPTRLIPTLAGSQFGTIDTAIVANAGDTVEIKFATTSAGANQYLTDSDDATERGYILLTSTDKVTFDAAEITGLTLDGVAVVSGTTNAPNDGKIHTFVATFAALTKVGVIGASNSFGSLFNGQILSTKFTNNTTGEVINYVFDSGSDLYQLPRGEGLGVEEITQGTFDTDATDGTFAATYPTWNKAAGYLTSVTDGVLLIDRNGAGLVNTTHDTITSVAGEVYAVSIDIDSASHDWSLTVDGVSLSGTVGTTGLHEYVATASDTSLSVVILALSSTVATVGINSITIKKLPALNCSLTNFATTDWNRFTLQRNILHDAGVIVEAWVGDNVVVNGRFDDASAWIINDPSWSISGGVASGDGTNAGTIVGIYEIAGTIAGNIYLTRFKVLNFISGSVATYLDPATFTYRTADGDYSEVLAAVDNQVRVRCTIATDVSIDNVSAQHLLEVA